MAGQISFSLIPYFLVLILVGTCYASSKYTKDIRLRLMKNDVSINTLSEPEYKIYNYTQTLDHFNYQPQSYATFQQRYLVNSKYWGGSLNNSPIFVYTGEESDVVGDADFLGYLPVLASRFNGLLLYIEHRYYGTSMPFGSEDEAYRNASTLGYFSSEQALADYAQLIRDFKSNYSAESCPVIAVGASYGGMLASWFRLKYPHIVYGTLASSAPILYFENLTPHDAYDVKVSEYFKETSKNCYHTIRKSWFVIDDVAAQPNGLFKLSQTFNTCQPLNSSQPLKDALEGIYDTIAQYDYPSLNWGPRVCGGIDGASKETGVLEKIVAGMKAVLGNECFFTDFKPSNKSGWTWQTCTEIVIPYGRGANDTMFQAAPFDLKQYTENCQNLFGISPRPNWATTEFGGYNIRSVLKKFASNIIFSNGLQDPYSSGGILKDISDTVVAIHAKKASHCLDLHTPDATADPVWLVKVREREIKVIERWLKAYGKSD